MPTSKKSKAATSRAAAAAATTTPFTPGIAASLSTRPLSFYSTIPPASTHGVLSSALPAGPAASLGASLKPAAHASTAVNGIWGATVPGGTSKGTAEISAASADVSPGSHVTSPRTGPNIVPIIAGCIGGLLVLALLGFGIFCLKKRRRAAKQDFNARTAGLRESLLMSEGAARAINISSPYQGSHAPSPSEAQGSGFAYSHPPPFSPLQLPSQQFQRANSPAPSNYYQDRSGNKSNAGSIHRAELFGRPRPGPAHGAGYY